MKSMRKRRWLLLSLLVVPLSIVLVLQLVMSTTMGAHYRVETPYPDVSLREFPYPFQAALSISSDIDATKSLEQFLTIQEFLNTDHDTPLGRGVGLEISNSFFPEGDDFSFLSDSASQQVIIDLIRLGYIDFIHSFRAARNRDEMLGIVDALRRQNCSFQGWSNHSISSSNIGSGAGCWGDDTSSSFYHADFSLDGLGCRFVWMDGMSEVLGQGRPITLPAFIQGFDAARPWDTFYQFSVKGLGKYLASLAGSNRYKMYKHNELVQTTALENGRKVLEFSRSSYSFGGVWGHGSTAAELGEALRRPVLLKLAEAGGYSIIYTHLGKGTASPYLPVQTREALRDLAEMQTMGKIYVTCTSKLLNYYVNKKYLRWSREVTPSGIAITISHIDDPLRGRVIPMVADLQGITFYTDSPTQTSLHLGEQELGDVQVNGADQTGRGSISIPLVRLAGLEDRIQVYKAKGYF